jgi:hypothetical protein
VTPGGRFRYAVDAFLAKQALKRERVQAELAKKKATRDAARRQRIERKRQQEAVDAGDRARYTSSLDP